MMQQNTLPLNNQKELFLKWNDTEQGYPSDKTIYQLFEEQVKKTPKNVAVIFENQQLTYQELNERSNQIAHHLIGLGVKPDTFVAIFCERSLDMIVGIIAILKAGGAYVPIDSAYPQERVEFILEDTQVSILLTQISLLEKLSKTTAEVILLDQNSEAFKNFPTINTTCLTSPNHLAYVIYTSGSTGKPKGVMIEHKSICDRLFWHQAFIPLTAEDRCFHQISYSFDASVVNFFWPLMVGAQIIITPSRILADSLKLRELIQDHKVTLLYGTPHNIKIIFNNNNLKALSSVEKIIFGGAALTYDDIKTTNQEKERQIYNLYGPTECSVTAVATLLTQDHDKVIPIGKPIANTHVYILDSNLQQVAIGETGELYIGGKGLARGYLNAPELTTEKFISNPFQTEKEKDQRKNARLYKTGDLCRWLEDGNIEYIGRNDNQVKILGYRIELGEIEKTLLKHSDIKEAVVEAKETPSGERGLVAYLILTNREKEVTNYFDSYLRKSLPDYMIPSVFVPLSSMPLTVNGKIDRQQLPNPWTEKIDKKEKVEISGDITEEKLLQIYKEALQTSISFDDNFFEWGGNSLLASHITAQINKVLNVSLSMNIILTYPTITQVAKYLKMQECLLTES